jgi:hypothetical protein
MAQSNDSSKFDQLAQMILALTQKVDELSAQIKELKGLSFFFSSFFILLLHFFYFFKKFRKKI